MKFNKVIVWNVAFESEAPDVLWYIYPLARQESLGFPAKQP